MTPELGSGFAGEVLYGDAWRGHDVRGKRVAVVATGRDAVRVVPSLALGAASVKVFLEDPDWVLPRLPGPASGVVRLGAAVPVLGPRARRLLARAHLRVAVRDAWTRRLLTPDDRFGAHATATSSAFYAALQAGHVKLLRWPVYAVTAHGIRTAEGIEHRVDVLVVPAPARLRRTPNPARQTPRTRTRTRIREDRSA